MKIGQSQNKKKMSYREVTDKSCENYSMKTKKNINLQYMRIWKNVYC